MLILSSISSGLEFWSENQTYIKIANQKLFKNIKFIGEISNNWSYDLLEANVYKTLESYLQYYSGLIILH